MKIISIEHVFAAAKDRPKGYADDVLRASDRRGNLLFISDRDYAALLAKYRQHRSPKRLVAPGFPESQTRLEVVEKLERMAKARIGRIPMLLECARMLGESTESIESKLDLLKRICLRLNLGFKVERSGPVVLMVAANHKSCLALPKKGLILFCRMDGPTPIDCQPIRPLLA